MFPAAPASPYSAMRAILNGAWRFALVGLLSFGFWALAPKFLPKQFGETGVFAGCLVCFCVFAEIFLAKLAHEPNARAKFNRSFIPAFVAYAIVWSACWFALKFGRGEWLGSALGCAAFAFILGKQLGAREGYCKVILFLIFAHAAGYFGGGKLFYMARHPPPALASLSKDQIWTVAKLAWGLCYGLGFGAGIGYAFDVFQKAAPVNAD
jgi:hypothetical protein